MFPETFHPPRPPLPGFVYVMKNAKGHYKIGHANDKKAARKRRSQISSLANQVSIVLLIPTDDMIALELELQHRYVLLRTRGEWFKLSRQDVHALRQLIPRED